MTKQQHVLESTGFTEIWATVLGSPKSRTPPYGFHMVLQSRSSM